MTAIFLRTGPSIPPAARTLAVLGMAVMVIVWELVGGSLLAVPRLRAPGLAFSWTIHASLALVGFVDFGALALALLYFAINVAAGVISALRSPGDRRGAVQPGSLRLHLASALRRCRFAQAGMGCVPLGSRLTPRWMFAFPVLLLLHGLTSYVGLRTAGNLSMFSNLRTEGARSNHLLLGGNPVVEFRKLIHRWTTAGATIPLTFLYRGRVHSTKDIVNDPAWRTDSWDWEMRLVSGHPAHLLRPITSREQLYSCSI